jgi:uncharacterized protein (TIGR02186 family)
VGVFGLDVKKLAWLGLLAATILVPPAAEASSAKIRLFPDRVEVGAFFQGAEVALQGEIPSGAEAVVEIRGATAQEELLRKGRRGGLWMTVGEISVENTPNLYLVLSSAADVPTLDGQETPWGFSALKSRVKFRGALADQEKDRFFQELLELKKSEELYDALPGALKIRNSPLGQAVVKGTFHLPAKVPPGTYQVRLSVVKDGRVMEQKSEELQVKMVGFPALLAALAYEHGALYGIVAVVIAIATGFIMGLLFKGKAEH